MEKTTIIEGRRYHVELVFRAVGNWHFIDKNGVHYLVDAEDVGVWADENGKEWRGIDTAIEYARELARDNNGVFYWKIKNEI